MVNYSIRLFPDGISLFNSRDNRTVTINSANGGINTQGGISANGNISAKEVIYLCNGKYTSVGWEIDRINSEINNLSGKIDTNYSDLSGKIQSSYDTLWGQILQMRDELKVITGGGNS